MREDPRRLVHAAARFACVVLAVGAAACSGSHPGHERAAAPAGAHVLTPAERVAWYQDCWSHFNAKAWDRFRACYADDVASEQVDSGHPHAKGFDAMEAGVKSFVSAFPDVKGTPELILIKGETILGIQVLTGTHTGALIGPDGTSIAPSDKPFGFYQAHLARTDPAGNRVVKEQFYSDSGTLMAQLGLNPAPARPIAAVPASAPTVVAAAGTPAELGNLDLLRAQMAAYNSHDAKGVDACNAPGLVIHDMAMPADQSAKESFAGMQEFFKAFPDAKLAPESIWAAGSYVVAAGRLTGTNKGAMPAIGVKKPTGKTLSIQYLDVTRWENGKLQEEWMFYDGAAFAQQLGLGRK
jgi:predicted ester cyclase